MAGKKPPNLWEVSPTRWPLAAAALTFFAIATGFAVSHEDGVAMMYTCVVVGSALIGAWIYALGRSRYGGESDPDEAPEPRAGKKKPPTTDQDGEGR